MGLGKIGEPRGLRAPHRSRVNGNVLLLLSMFLLSAHGTKQVVRGVVGPRVGKDSCQDSAVLRGELGLQGAENLCFLFGPRGRSHSGSHAAVLSLSIRPSVFSLQLLEPLPAATLGLFFLLPPLRDSPGVDLN